MDGEREPDEGADPRAAGPGTPRSPAWGFPRTDPGACGHERLRRLGVQKVETPPFRFHLVECLGCRTTLATESLRSMGPRGAAGGR